MPNYFSVNDLNVHLTGSHQTDSIGTNTDTLTIPSDASGVFIQALEADVYFRLDGDETDVDGTGFQLFTSDGITRFDLEPGAEIAYQGGDAASELRYQFFAVSDGIA